MRVYSERDSRHFYRAFSFFYPITFSMCCVMFLCDLANTCWGGKHLMAKNSKYLICYLGFPFFLILPPHYDTPWISSSPPHTSEEHAVAVAVAVAVPFPLPHTPHFSPSTFRDSGLDDFVSVLISYEESMSRSLQLGLWKEAYTRLIILFTYKAHVPASRLLFPSNANPVP